MSVYGWLYKIFLIINYYVREMGDNPNSDEAIDKLKRILERLYYRIERKYYYDILEPNSRYYFTNTSSDD